MPLLTFLLASCSENHQDITQDTSETVEITENPDILFYLPEANYGDDKFRMLIRNYSDMLRNTG